MDIKQLQYEITELLWLLQYSLDTKFYISPIEIRCSPIEYCDLECMT